MTAPALPITPTGILLGNFTPGTPEWEEARAGLTVTATEIAAIVGLSPCQSRFSLWHKKTGMPTPPFEPSPAMEWGIRHEPTIAAKYAEQHPELALAKTGTWRHRDREWQRATPDLVGDDRLVEIKTATTDKGWGESGSDDVPIYYRCQVTWQMDTLGYRRTDFAVLIGNCDYREYTVEYDETDAAMLRDAAQTFLHDVRHGNRPPIDGADATYQTIRVQPDGIEDVDIEIPFGLVCRWDDAYAAHHEATEKLTAVRGEVLDHIGTGKRAVCEGRRIAYRTVNPDGTTHALQPYRSTAA